MPINKKEGESKDEFMGRCIGIEIANGKDPSQAAAICYSKWESFGATNSATTDFPPANIEFESYTDYPKQATENAKIALRWAEENGWGSCGTPVGKARANQLANGEAISRETIARMAAFERHRQNSDKELGDGCGRLVWLAWGGDEGIEWAQRKLKQFELSTEMLLSKISFDYDDTLSTSRGKELAQRAIDNGDTIYIISARSDKEGMLAVADELGIPHSRVYATGSNKAKEEKIKELGIDKHIDNNSDVIDALPGIGYKFGKNKKVIFNEDFDPEIAKQYKEAGFKVHIRSARKIYRKDKKVWNKLKQANLNEDAIVFGEIKELDDKYEYDLLLTGADPIIERMKLMGTTKNDFKVLKSIVINNMDEAKAAQDMVNEFDMKFVSIKVVYTYELRPDAPQLKEGGSSRPFCETNLGKTLTYDEIQQLSNSHLVKMGITPPDVFQYKGGFYTTPGGKRGPNTTPWCRHQWTARAILQ